MYGFRLADSQCWGIQSGEETAEWADELARLLGLGLLQGLPDETIRLERLQPLSGPENVGFRAPHGCAGTGWHLRTSPFIELWRHPALREIICGLHDTQNFLQVKEQMRCALFPVYDLTLRRGGLPLHGALVEQGGRGVLLVGRSGVGKSTACHRLPPRWDVLGDDLALAVQRPGGGFAVHPLPTWSAVGEASGEKTWDIQCGVCLSAVFFLTQAAEDEILPAGKAVATVILADAAMTIFQSVRMKDRSVEKKLLGGNAFANAAAMAKSVPTYILRLSLTGRFWERIEDVLAAQETDNRPVKETGRISHVRRMEKGDSPLFSVQRELIDNGT